MTIATPDFEYLATLISERTGNVIRPSQDYLLESRLSGLIRELKLDSIDALLQELRKLDSEPLKARVADAMTINETSFFRDPPVFDTLKDEVLPALIQARQATRRIDIWCAASSSGQEPYSIAILLKEHFPQLDPWNIRILCTDYSQRMVDRTREGKYSQFEANRGLPARLLATYFDRQGLNWVARDELKRMMDCRVCNLTQPWRDIPTVDLVMMRNVLIYFDKPIKEQVLRQTRNVIREDGFLFLGGGETLINLDVPFRGESHMNTPVYRPCAL